MAPSPHTAHSSHLSLPSTAAGPVWYRLVPEPRGAVPDAEPDGSHAEGVPEPGGAPPEPGDLRPAQAAEGTPVPGHVDRAHPGGPAK